MKTLGVLRLLNHANKNHMRVSMLVYGQLVRFQKIEMIVSGQAAAKLSTFEHITAYDRLDSLNEGSAHVPPLSEDDVYLTAEGFTLEQCWVRCGFLFDATSINAIAFTDEKVPLPEGSMNTPQLRQALRELNGERDLIVAMAGASTSAAGGTNLLEVKKAMLIPDEPDHLVKVTDGKAVFIIDAARVAWIRIGLK